MANLKIKRLENNDEASNIMYRDFVTLFRKGFIVIGDEEMVITENFEEYAQNIENFEVRDSDVFVVSYPKSGTTWTQEMVWMISNNLDFKTGEKPLGERFPFFEICTIFDQKEISKVLGGTSPKYVANSIEFIEQQDNPRFIKTHLPFSFLPKQIRNKSKVPKIIYITRNPKDVCISYYHHAKLLEGYRGSFEDFCTLFLSGTINYGSYWKNIFGYWEKRNWENLLILSYEEMKEDLPAVIRNTAQFLNKTLTVQQIEVLTNHLSFKSMKNNPALNLKRVIEQRKKLNLCVENGEFLRSGTVEQYKMDMSSELVKKFDKWIEQNTAGSDFTLY